MAVRGISEIITKSSEKLHYELKDYESREYKIVII